MKFKLKKFKELTTSELYDLLQLRQQIFIVEQSCIYLDADGIDKKCLHLLGLVNNKIVAYARIIPTGISYKTPSIGRVVIDERYRGNKYAYQLMGKAIEITAEKFKPKKITISAQVYLKGFYQNLGFKAVGNVYLEDELPHLKMILLVL
jgi:ElaA protein